MNQILIFSLIGIFGLMMLVPTQYAEAKDLIINENCNSEGLWEITITNEEGKPLQNVRLGTLKELSTREIEESFFTDENGYATIPYSSNTGFVKLSKGGYNEKSVTTICTGNKSTCLAQQGNFKKNDSYLYLVHHWPLKSDWYIEGYENLNTVIVGDVVNLSEFSLTDIIINVKTYREGQLLEDTTSWYPIKKILRPGEASPFAIAPSLTGFDHYEIWVGDYTQSCTGVAIPKSMIESVIIDVQSNGPGTLTITCDSTVPTREAHDQHILFVAYNEANYIESIEMGPFFLMDSYDCFKIGKTDASPFLEYAKQNRLELFVIEGPKNLIFNEKDIRIQNTFQTNVYSHYYPNSLHPKYMNLNELKILAEKGTKIQTSDTAHEDVFDEKSMIIESLNLQGLYSLESGKYWDAISWFDNALEHDPQNREVLYNKALALKALGLEDDANKILENLEEKKSPMFIPEWVRSNAQWWAQGAIGDSDFTTGIQFLINEGIIIIPETPQTHSDEDSKEIPSWIKNNADWWSQGLISDNDFVKGIQYLVENGIIRV